MALPERITDCTPEQVGDIGVFLTTRAGSPMRPDGRTPLDGNNGWVTFAWVGDADPMRDDFDGMGYGHTVEESTAAAVADATAEDEGEDDDAPEREQELAYPAPGAEIPDQPGNVVGTCGHRVAASEWRAGFRTCERCPREDEGEDDS
jgi:hypothetical protein